MKIIYCRKSQESDERQVQSIEGQLEWCRNYAKNMGFQILEEIIESKSAKKPGREGFTKLIKLLDSGKADGIICWELNRLSRNSYDEGIIKWAVQEGKIKDIHATTGICNNENILMMSIFFGMATQYIVDLSRSVKRGLNQKAETGGATSKARIGYKNNKETNEWEIDKEKAELVKEIFELRKRNYGFAEIGKILYRKGYITSSGRAFSGGYIESIIKDDTFLGIKNFNGLKFKGKHPAIISQKLWEEANGIKTPNVINLDINYNEFIFKGKIRYQGKLMSPYLKKGNIYYREGRGIKPPYNLSQKIIIELFGDELSKFNFPEEFKNIFTSGIVSYFKANNQVNKSEVIKIQKEIDRLNQDNKEYAKKNAKGLLSDELMIELHNENFSKTQELKKDLEIIKQNQELKDKEVFELLKMLTESEKEFKKGDLSKKLDILNLVLFELYFNEKKELSITYTKLFSILQKFQFL